MTLSKKTPPLTMTFEKFFQNTTLRQNTGKETERTEVFDFGSENFHKTFIKFI